jgi:hypothetical protein
VSTPRGRGKPAKPPISRFLDPAKIDSALAKVAEIAASEGLRLALAGGAALQLYGSDRFTRDVDIAADRCPQGVKRRGILAFGGIKTALAGVATDFIVRDDQYAALYDEAIEHAHHVTGSPVPVVTLPYLAAMKMVAGRGKNEQDLHFALTHPRLNYKIARAVVAQHLGPYAADELDAIRDVARWEKSREPGARKQRK